MSRQQEARDLATLAGEAYGEEGRLAKAEAAKALAILDLGAAVRFHALIGLRAGGRGLSEAEIDEVARIAGVND